MSRRPLNLPVAIAFLFTLLLCQTVFAVPANPTRFFLVQPDGSTFQARQVGDERGAHFETQDGFTIIKDKNNWWNYARKEKGKLVSSGNRVTKFDPNGSGLQKHLHPTLNEEDLTSIGSGPIPTTSINQIPKKSSSPAGISSPESAPQTGTKKVLVILINFTDVTQNAGNTPSYYDNLLFNDSAGANSMNNYYKEVSYNQVNITGVIAGDRWYSSAYNESYYGKDSDHNNGDHDDYYGYIFRLAREALLLADADVDFSAYDTNDDGILNQDEIHIIIVHAGCGEEDSSCTGWNTDAIWSHRWDIFGSPYNCPDCIDTVLDGVRISRNDNLEDIAGYTMQAENSPLGTFAHEFGHDLGLPDLYDTDYTSNGIGDWGIMASGSWLNNGNTPSHFSAWSKYFLGWARPTKVITSLFNEQINQTETHDDVYMLLDNPGDSPGNLDWTDSGTGSGEYFLVENRRKTGYDAYLPGEGLLIWHIDESRRNNTDETHYLVALEQADGLFDLENDVNRGDANDPWISSVSGFTETSTPNTTLYNGSASGIRVTAISASSNVMTADLIVNWPPATITFVDPTPSNNSNLNKDYVFVNVTASEPLSTALLEWNGTNETMTSGSWYKNETGLADGTYTYRVWGNDSGGNWNVTETRVVTIDTTGPTITISSPTNDTINDNTPLLNATFNEVVNYTWYNVNGTNSLLYPNTQNLTLNLSELSEGPHNITVYANDSTSIPPLFISPWIQHCQI